MINQDVKNALLKAIEDLVSRIMAQAGMKESEVSQLILDMFADAQETLDPTITDKLISPKAAFAIAEHTLTANIGTAPDEYNSIEKIGTFIPEMLQQLNKTLTQLTETLRDEIAEAASGANVLSDILAKHGIVVPLNFKVNTPEVQAIIGTSLSQLLALEVGTYTGYAKASTIGLNMLVGQCGGVPYDEEVLLKIEHIGGPVYHQIRRAYTQKGMYVTSWNSSMTSTIPLMTGWQRPPEFQQELYHPDNFMSPNENAQFDFIGQLEMAGVPIDLSRPYLEWMGHYHVHKDWMTERQLAHDLIFWVSSSEATQGRPAEWFIIADAVHQAGWSGDRRSEWEARGAKIIASGTWLDFGHPGTDPSNIKWKVETVSGQPRFAIHSVPHGEPLPPNSPRYNGGDITSDFSVSVVSPFNESSPGVYNSELVLRITCTDSGSGHSHSRLLRLTKTIDNRLQQLPILGTTVGNLVSIYDQAKSSSNALVKTNRNLQLGANVNHVVGRLSPINGVLPKVDPVDSNVKTFYFNGRRVSSVDLGVALLPDFESSVCTFSELYTVGIELTYDGVTRIFEFIDDYRLSEKVNGVLTGQTFDNVIYLVNMEGIQWVSIVCGKTTDAPVSMLETLFPAANTYVAAQDDSGGTSWFAHNGKLEIKLTATPKDPLNTKDYMELVTAVYLSL